MIFVSLFAVGSFIVTLFLSSPAYAATRASSPAVKSAASHCVEQLSPVRAGQTASDVQSFKCYATLSASIAAATGGRIHLPANASSQSVSQALQGLSRANAISPNILNVVSVLFKDANFGGDSLTVQTTGAPCSSTIWYGLQSLNDGKGWDNVISSFRSYYGCAWTRLFANSNYTGASQCYQGPSVSNVGPVMNDQTTSITFRDHDTC